MSILSTTLVESSYTGYNMLVMVIPIAAVTCLMVISSFIEQREFMKAIKVVAAVIFVVGLLFSYIPLQTNATGQLQASEQPESFTIQSMDYEYEHPSDIQIKSTDENVEEIKIFGENQNQPTSQAERLTASPETTLELPETDTIIIITYDENGEIIEETQIQLNENVNKTTIL